MSTPQDYAKRIDAIMVPFTSLSAGTRRIRVPPDGVGNFRGVAVALHATRLGLGDVLLRSKLTLLRAPWADVAAGLILRLPTGRAADFQGTGAFEITPALYGASRPYRIGGDLIVRAYGNALIDVSTANAANSQGRWGVGLDLGVTRRVTLGVSVVGRHAFARVAPRGFFDVPPSRCRPRTSCRS